MSRPTPLLLFFAALLMLGGCQCSDPGSDGPSQTNNSTVGSTNNATEGADPCAPNPCQDGRACFVQDDRARCACPAGTHEEDGICTPDTACLENTCNSHGVCSMSGDELQCECELGYGGDFCETCDEAAGFYPDGNGECTDDPCSLVRCDDGEECVVEDGEGVCTCPAGTHREGARCVTDETCRPTTCNERGSCDDSGGLVVCTCDEGFAGEFCRSCDASAGYHDDGMDGCTTDPCLPNPCSDPNRNECTADGTMAVCDCNDGYHFDGSGCVVDETCDAASCSGAGTCDDTGGVIDCTCDTGYMGATCEQCDAAAGYHDDGMGGCTDDACLPNPCTDPNKTTCVAGVGGYACECDAGFHPDGAGGCTDDPCLPDLCAAQNQACRVTNGMPECYTPDCDDQNPCTTDELVAGECEYTDVVDGSACASDVCTVGETCQAGQCVGGSVRNCDDQNPCTDDVCDIAQGGCVNTDDDTNVPDDGVDCTVDSCSNGVASHTADDTICDDGSWCTGVESCAPGDANAGADGCLTTNVPQPPPAPSPCQYYGACDDASQSFSLLDRPTGDPCDDGILCTSGDQCDAQGRCVGTVAATCDVPADPAACTTTNAVGDIDVSIAHLDVNVTVDGQDPEVSTPYYDFSLYAVSQSTGTWHQLLYYNHNYSDGNRVEESLRTLPGIYDIYYLNQSGSSDRFFSRSLSGRDLPYGMRVLQRDVALRAGNNTLDIDVETVPVTVNVTVDGQDPEVSTPYYDFSVYAVDQETGAWHQLLYYNHNYSDGNRVEETVRMLPGTYDLYYLNQSGSSETYYSRSLSGRDLPYGKRLLQTGVTVNASNTTIDVAVETVPVTVNVTVDGQDPEVSTPYYDFSVYAVDQQTGAWHQVLYYNHNYSDGNRVEETVRMLPGTYDLYYLNQSGSSETYYSRSLSGRDLPYGRRLLQTGVTVDASNTTVDVAVETVPVTVNVTVDGQDPEVSQPYYDFSVYAVDQETGAWHQVLYYNHNYSDGNRVEETVRMLPGTYDLYYLNQSGSSEKYYSRSLSGRDLPYGKRLLRTGVTVNASNTTIDVAVETVPVTVDVTVDGEDPEVSTPYYDFSVYAVDQETGAWHQVLYYNHNYSDGNRVEETVRMLPGTYDLYYLNQSGSSEKYYSRSLSGRDLPYANRLLQTGVVIDAANDSVTIDVPTVAYSPTILFDGEDPEVSTPYYDFSIYAPAVDTGAWHQLAYYNHNYSDGNRVEETTRILPGTYHVAYYNQSGSSDKYFSRNLSGRDAPYGVSYLQACVDLP